MLKVGICHQTLACDDAIGNDIAGAYRLLERMGCSPTILCEFSEKRLELEYRIQHVSDGRSVSNPLDLLLYHHSISWPRGEELVKSFSGPVVVKYHNVTPPDFFEPYAPVFAQACREAKEQTKRLAMQPGVELWQADSNFNADELRSINVPETRIAVVPPFNRIGEFLYETTYTQCTEETAVDLLFVGRRVPNKGHKHSIRTLKAYMQLFSSSVTLRMIGAEDGALRSYSEELFALADQLGVSAQIDWHGHISQEELHELFLRSHVYLNTSEHEGFCVPLIEAQAAGLPVVTVDSTAVKETIGPNQLVCPIPCSDDDYGLVAGLVHEVVHNQQLRTTLQRHGFVNARTKFSQEAIENKFVESLESILRSLF